MKKLKVLLIIFLTCICAPMVHVVYRTYHGLAQEEEAKLRFFADALFDSMEKEMARIIWREEKRAVDEYNFSASSTKIPGSQGENNRADLSSPPKETYILGYIQNNPDGSFQTPVAENPGSAPSDKSQLIMRLKKINTIFNAKKYLTRVEPVEPSGTVMVKEKEKPKGYADSYLSRSKKQSKIKYLGKKEKRVEKITATQALNLSRQDAFQSSPDIEQAEEKAVEPDAKSRDSAAASPPASGSVQPARIGKIDTDALFDQAMENVLFSGQNNKDLQVEIAPFQSVFIDGKTIFIFRRVMISDHIYRQGFALNINAFLSTLLKEHFLQEPMAVFSRLKLNIINNDHVYETMEDGATVNHVRYAMKRRFPRPFNFIKANLVAETLPKSPSRTSLTITMTILAMVLLMGFTAIYKSMRTIVDLSERRSRFVSSVTHELKTPLTNIRMYIEMLQQGIAQTPDREDQYLSILGSESTRLSRLINNVLELSRLEKKQRKLVLEKGTFKDVIREVQAIMAPKLTKEGFSFTIQNKIRRPFPYDREVMVQIIVNLMENSIKFGRKEPVRSIALSLETVKDKTKIRVSDTGPGIPKYALKQIFDDFYRVEDDKTDSVQGTGIGLALVKKFIAVTGGTVSATNNEGPGCTISMSVPS